MLEGGEIVKIRKERPRCRKVLVHLCDKYNCTLGDLLKNHIYEISDGLRTQARKMLDEFTCCNKCGTETTAKDGRVYCPNCQRYGGYAHSGLTGDMIVWF